MVKPLWWWSQAEDGEPGKPIERLMTTDQQGYWVLPIVSLGAFVELHGHPDGTLSCSIKRTVKRAA